MFLAEFLPLLQVIQLLLVQHSLSSHCSELFDQRVVGSKRFDCTNTQQINVVTAVLLREGGREWRSEHFVDDGGFEIESNDFWGESGVYYV